MTWSDAFTALSTGTAVLLIFILIFTIGPWLLFWAIGTVTTAAGVPVLIPFTFKTWLAGFVFLVLVRGGKKSSS